MLFLAVACGSSFAENENPNENDAATGGSAGASGAAGSGGTAGASVDAGDASDAGNPVDASDAGDATCGDTQSDPENCGSCGHSCLGGKCQNSMCLPVTLAALEDEEPRYVTEAGDVVYFTSSAGVRAVPKDGSTAATLLSPSTSGALRGLERSGNWLYAADSSGGVSRTALAGGAAQPLWAGTGAPETVTVVAPYVYWADPSANAILRVAQGGGVAELVSTTLAQNAYALAKDDQVLYWVRRNGIVARLDLAQSSTAVKIADLGKSTASAHVAIAVSSPRVYFSHGGSATEDPVGTSVPLGGGVQLPFTTDPIWDIATDNTHVYWSRVGLTGAIKRRAQPNTGSEEELVSGLTEVRGLALDSSALYFSEYDASSNKGWIKKLAK
jgi:hypothetical protein